MSSNATLSAPALIRRLRRVRVLRNLGLPVYQNYRRLTASGQYPPLFINSMPKAGTHLVASMVARAPRLKYSGQLIVHDLATDARDHDEGIMPMYEQDRLSRMISSVRSGTFANCHLYFDSYTEALLSDRSRRAVVVVRDPRDIVLSQVRYIEQFPAHERHRYLMGQYDTTRDRLWALIEGWPASAQERGMADLGSRLRSYVGWASSDVAVFRYEDLVASPSDLVRSAEIDRLRCASGLEHSTSAENLARGIGDKWSATMNVGSSYAWRTGLSKAQAERVAELAHDTFDVFGYS